MLLAGNDTWILVDTLAQRVEDAARPRSRSVALAQSRALTPAAAPTSRFSMDSPGHRLSDPKDWVERHGDYLYRFAMLRVRDPDLAEELVQETYLAALKSQKSFAGQSSERTWYVGILKHKIIDHYRKAYRERPLTDLDAPDAVLDEMFDAKGSVRAKFAEWRAAPSQVAENREFWTTFENCLGTLPERTSAAFTLREIDQLTGEDICEALDITPSNFWVMLHRARAKLRACLDVNWFGKSEDGESKKAKATTAKATKTKATKAKKKTKRKKSTNSANNASGNSSGGSS